MEFLGAASPFCFFSVVRQCDAGKSMAARRRINSCVHKLMIPSADLDKCRAYIQRTAFFCCIFLFICYTAMIFWLAWRREDQHGA